VLLRRAAELGYVPAQAEWAWCCGVETERYERAEKTAAQGDRNGLFELGYCLWNGLGCERDRNRAVAFWKEAAELGNRLAQFRVGRDAFAARDWQRFHWLGKSAAWGYASALTELQSATREQLELFDEGSVSGRAVFELGATFKEHVDTANGMVFDELVDVKDLKTAQRCVELHGEWTTAAQVAIECWLVISMRRGVVKDIRLGIARLLWDEPWAWSGVSERKSQNEREGLC
jgi:hypothetical protein